MTFAQLVASVYIASMLTGQRRPEVGELPVNLVGFQNGPHHPVDDLLISCGDGASEVVLAVACRATPDFVSSDAKTVKLVRSLLAEVETFDSDSHQVAVATLGWRDQWHDLAKLCDIARAHASQVSFEASIDTDGRWTKEIRGRFDQFKLMVGTASGMVSDGEMLRLSWRLLSRLHVLGFRVQEPDESDRTAVATMLDAVADAAVDGVVLRDRLESLVAGYDAKGGVADLNLVRRDLHSLLNAVATRSKHAWQVLAELREQAVSGVRASIGEVAVGGPVEISFADRRASLAAELLGAGLNQTVLLVAGESGIGKSALTLSAVAELEATNQTGFEAVVLNFRSLPQTMLELRAALTMSVKDVLSELSAPSRVLVIDAADVALERSAGLLSDLVLAAKAAGVGVAAVSSDVAADFVAEQLKSVSAPVVQFVMDLLGDEDIEVVANAFPLLRPVLRDLPEKSLLRRPVVLDLLARAGVAPSGSLGEWECLDLIWSKVVRADGRPDAGSPEAREQTMLAVSAAAFQLPGEMRPATGVDGPSIDALRKSHLLAPPNPYRSEPELAHDEVRRYATAILLVRAASMTEVLEASRVRRVAMSAATLACQGKVKAAGPKAKSTFLDLLGQFRTLAEGHGARWADVPVEAVLATPAAYDCLNAALDDTTTGLVLADVIRVVRQRHKVGALISPAIAGEVVRLLLDHERPWDVSEGSFELLADWLTALTLSEAPTGHPLRIALRDRLLTYWKSFPPVAPASPGAPGPASVLAGPPRERRRLRGQLDHQQTSEQFVETMALLGADIDDEVEGCLRAIAEDAPAFLAPAADSPISSHAVAQRDPELLADLMEAYYVDDDHSWARNEGVRRHQGRWHGIGSPFSAYYFGGFWQLFHSAQPGTQVRVLNNILNSGANARVKTSSRLGSPDVFGLPADESESGDPVDEDKNGATAEDRGAVLNLDGAPRLYVGDSHVWWWYRGTSVGPYSAMSALQAMERTADTWLTQGASPRRVVEVLLTGCENLAVPGLLFGLLVRHLDKVGDELDAFLAEPIVWHLEFGRRTSEYSGLRARTDDLVNDDRRQWTPREVAAMLLTRGAPDVAKRLKRVGDKLIENGDKLGTSRDLTMNWAASLDADRYKITQVAEGYQIEVEPPAELVASQEAHAAYFELVSTSTRLQNRYWGSAKYDGTYVGPTADEVAADLVAGRALFEADSDMVPNQPEDAVAHVIRAAVEFAVAGDLTAFGDEAAFATQFVISVAGAFTKVHDQEYDGSYFDLGADRAIASALPAYLTVQLAGPLKAGGGTVARIAELGLAVASNASLETRLYLARGCDIIWSLPCAGNPCTHRIALDWLTETARRAEIGPWDQDAQTRPKVRIDGDVAERLQELPGDSVDISALDAAIRGLGAAASTDHCCTAGAAEFLAALLEVEANAMVVYEEHDWTADDGGNHTLVAARALLNGIAANGDIAPALAHLNILRADSGLLTNFLHGLAAAGAESESRAQAARHLWPCLLQHAVAYSTDEKNPYMDRTWGNWASAALLPDPLAWGRGMYSESLGEPIDWVQAEDLVEFVDDWLTIGRGETKCVDALIGLLRRLPLGVQVTRGIAWFSDLCIQDGKVSVNQSWASNDWLKELRATAEELDLLDEWQMLVDSLVVAGNEGLAPFSR